MRYVCKNPPGGERNPYQLIDYTYLSLKMLKKKNRENTF